MIVNVCQFMRDKSSQAWRIPVVNRVGRKMNRWRFPGCFAVSVLRQTGKDRNQQAEFVLHRHIRDSPSSGGRYLFPRCVEFRGEIVIIGGARRHKKNAFSRHKLAFLVPVTSKDNLPTDLRVHFPDASLMRRWQFKPEVNGEPVGDVEPQALVPAGEPNQAYLLDPRFLRNSQHWQAAFGYCLS